MLEFAGTVDVAPELSDAVGFAGFGISGKAAESEVDESVVVVVAPSNSIEEVGVSIVTVGHNERKVAVGFDRESSVAVILI